MKKGFVILLILISFLFVIPTLTGCSDIMQMFYTEEKETTLKTKKRSNSKVQTTVEVGTNTSNSNKTNAPSTSTTTEITTEPTGLYIRKTSLETTEKSKMTYPKTSSDCVHNEVNYDGKQYSQFKFYGYDGGIACTVCQKALDLNLTEPYGEILFSHSEYYEGENNSKLSSYTIVMNEEDIENSVYDNKGNVDTTLEFRFTLIKNTFENNEYKISYYTGKMNVFNENIYILKYDGGLRNDDYAVFKENEFMFTDSTGEQTGYSLKEKKLETNLVYNPRKGNTEYAFNFFNHYENKVYYQNLYYDLYKLAEGLYNSAFDVPEIRGEHLISIIDTRRYNLTTDEIYGVWNVFMNSSPMYFFLSNKIKIVDGSYPMFLIDDYYSLGTARSSSKTMLTNIINTVKTGITGLGDNITDKDRVKYINDYLCDNLEYAWKDLEKTIPETEHWAHSVSGLLLNSKGVCECYSKSFLILALNNDIDSLIVTGTTDGDGHSWNIVKVEDSWYGVDVTWNDQASGKIYTYLCASKSVIEENRTIDGYLKLQMTYQYLIPELSTTGLTW